MDIKFAYWATNLGGLVFSKVPQNTDWTFRYNAELAQTAEASGFEYSLIAARFILTHGRGDHLEALSTVSALAAVTQRHSPGCTAATRAVASGCCGQDGSYY